MLERSLMISIICMAITKWLVTVVFSGNRKWFKLWHQHTSNIIKHLQYRKLVRLITFWAYPCTTSMSIVRFYQVFAIWTSDLPIRTLIKSWKSTGTDHFAHDRNATGYYRNTQWLKITNAKQKVDICWIMLILFFFETINDNYEIVWVLWCSL